MDVNAQAYKTLQQNFKAQYDSTLSASDFSHINKAIDAGLNKTPCNTTALDALIAEKRVDKLLEPTLREAFISLIDGSDQLNSPVVENNNALPIPSFITPAMHNAFAALSKFGCEDALTFSNDISGRQYYTKHQVLNRVWRHLEDADRATSLSKAKHMSMLLGLPQERTLEEWLKKFSSISQATGKAKNGICTSYAWAAAHTVARAIQQSNGNFSGIHRLEVVYWQGHNAGHNYIILNREAGGAPEHWGDASYVLDLWLGTLGHAYIFKPKELKAKRDYLTNGIVTIFDSNDYEWAQKGERIKETRSILDYPNKPHLEFAGKSL